MMFKYYLMLSWLSVKRTPMLTALMVLAIGLGISVTMTVLTVNYLMGKDPIPEKSHQLFHVQLYTYGKDRSNPRSADGYPYQVTYQDAMNLSRSEIPNRKTRSLQTGYSVIPSSSDSSPFMETARAIDSDFFAMFKVPFIYGGAWESSVDTKAKQVVVLGKEINDRLFKGENSVGKQVNLNSNLYTVVGVIDDWQPAIHYYDLNNNHFGDTQQIFVPFSLLPVLELPSWGNNNGWKTETINTYQDKLNSEQMWNQFWVELESPQQKEKFQAWLEGYVEQQKQLGRFEHENAGGSLKDVVEWMDYNNVVSDDNTILVGLAFMFLAVCLINTIGLLLAKFLRRAPEVGVRRALGASQGEIFVQHLVDVGLIGLAGGTLGLLLGQLGLWGIKQLYANYHQLVYMDMTLVVLAILIAIGSSVVAGLYPAWKICRTNPSIYLKIQ
ncbi:MAG: ABC transporter permease [Kangiellaceae bacterium]|nr:ABC transporter permease [Kangiellaceae bacterium]MCW8999839.1 ABC transporter permease [Kangiellaceae bacterium]